MKTQKAILNQLRLRPKRVLLPIAIFLLALLTTRYLFPDERKAILSLFDSASKLATFEGKEHPFASAEIAGQISELFTEDVSLQLKRPDRIQEILKSRAAIKQKLIPIRSSLAQLAVKFTDPEIKILGNKAHVYITGKAMGRDFGRSDYFLEVHRIECDLTKTHGRWQISRAVNVEPYEGVGVEENGL